MDFFRAQDQARRKTWQLAVLFGAAVITLVVLTNFVIAFALFMFSTSVQQAGGFSLQAIPLETWAAVSVGVLGIVGVATLYKYFIVRGGGRSVAEALGGHPLVYDTASFEERRLLNIVEEMAIASGTPVPPVYLIPEDSINAFAAGLSPDDAVIGINRGTINTLNRDELQGVVAHEFSHILNGDMSINLKLIALLHGILFIGLIGYGLLRGTGYSRNRDALPLLVIGGGLVVIGYGGTFFGNLIKSAVSRQREFLADASAVQFTRNPAGIADALKRIGGSTYGSQLVHRKAAEVSHLFFADALKRSLGGFFATHPPLDKRILAIQPNWNGKFLEGAAIDISGAASDPRASGFAAAAPDRAITEAVGNPRAAENNRTHELIDDLNDQLMAAAHEPGAARALTYAVLLDADEGERDKQMQWLEDNAERGVAPIVRRLYPLVADSGPLDRITLVELAMPSLKSVSRAQFERYFAIVRDLIEMDQKIALFEWVVYRVLEKTLRIHFLEEPPPKVRYGSVDDVRDSFITVLGALASLEHPTEQGQLNAINAGLASAGMAATDTVESLKLAELNRALGEMRSLQPLQKPAVLKACYAAMSDDNLFTQEAGALLHGVAAVIDCPLPIAFLANLGQSPEPGS